MTFREYLFLEDCRNKRGCKYWGDVGSGILPFCPTTRRFAASHRGVGVNEGGTFGIFGGGIFLDEYGFNDVDELINQVRIGSPIPQDHAKHELKQETGYNGPIQLQEIYVYKDEKMGPKGKPCNFYYWNYVGIVPAEFRISPEADSEWEEGGKSDWHTFEELVQLEPKHFGLKALLDNAAAKLQAMSQKTAPRQQLQFPKW